MTAHHSLSYPIEWISSQPVLLFPTSSVHLMKWLVGNNRLHNPLAQAGCPQMHCSPERFQSLIKPRCQYHNLDDMLIIFETNISGSSASFLAELPVRSPRKLFILIIYKYFQDQSIQKNILFNLEKESTKWE